MEYFSRLQKCWPEDGQAPASLPIAGERWKSYPIRSAGSHLFNESNSTFNASGAPTYVGPMPDEKQPKELFAKYFRRQPNTFLDIKVSSLTAKYFWVLSWQHRDVLSFEQVLASSNENYIFCFKPLTRYPSLLMYIVPVDTHEFCENEPLGYSQRRPIERCKGAISDLVLGETGGSELQELPWECHRRELPWGAHGWV